MDALEVSGLAIRKKKMPLIETNTLKIANDSIRTKNAALDLQRDFSKRVMGNIYQTSIDTLTRSLDEANQHYSEQFDDILKKAEKSTESYLNLGEQGHLFDERYRLVKVRVKNEKATFEHQKSGSKAIKQFADLRNKTPEEIRSLVDEAGIINTGERPNRYALIKPGLDSFPIRDDLLKAQNLKPYKFDIQSEVDTFSEKMQRQMNDIEADLNAMYGGTIYRAGKPKIPKGRRKFHDLTPYENAFLPKTTSATIAGNEMFRNLMRNAKNSYDEATINIGQRRSNTSRTSGTSYDGSRRRRYDPDDDDVEASSGF